MKKFFAIMMLLFPVILYAATCPPINTVFTKEGDKYIPAPPAGWQFSSFQRSHLDSADVRFVLAAYGADLHEPTDKDNHVRCYYGNPDLSPAHGIGIETIAIIPESALASHKEWYKNEHYYMCGRSNDVNECNFG